MSRFSHPKNMCHILLLNTLSGDSMQLSITILPGDRRMDFAADYLAKKGGTFCSSWSQIPESGYIVGGIPFTRDGRTVNTSIPEPLAIQSLLGMLTPNHILVGGNLPESVTTACTHHGIKYYDVMTSGDFVQKNARLTAEGLLIPLLSHTAFSIYDCKTLLIGYGRCGREIADILRFFVSELYVCDIGRSERKAAKASHFHVITGNELQDRKHRVHQVNTIINTAPTNPFPARTWGTFPEDCVILNVASSPLSVPFPLSEQVIPCPGIPGSYAPKTAGTIYAKEICNHFKV